MTPVRTLSPSISVTWPTRTPVTSVIAFSAPGGNTPGREPQIPRTGPLRHILSGRQPGDNAVQESTSAALHPYISARFVLEFELMRRNLLLAIFAMMPLATQAADNPFLGRWDFSLAPGRANWLSVSRKGAETEVWFQPTGGHVHIVKDFTLKGSHLEFAAAAAAANRPATTWELDAKDGQLVGVQRTGDRTVPLTGVRAPELKRSAPKSWSAPEALFDGKSLAGWEPIGDASRSHWVVKDGLLVNEDHGANLKSTRAFTDFKLHFEVNCPDNANSGFYLRGRYELQLEYVPAGTETA